MATTKKAVKKAAAPKPAPKPKVNKPKAEAAPKPLEAPVAPTKDAPEVEVRKPKHEPTKSGLGPIEGVLVNVILEGDNYIVTNITDRSVHVREHAPKGYYATRLEDVVLGIGGVHTFVRRDQVSLRPSYT